MGISIDIIFNANPSEVIIPNSNDTGTATDKRETIKYRLFGSKNNSIKVITKTVKTPNNKLSL